MKNRRIVKRHVLTEKVPLIVAAALIIIAQYMPNMIVSLALDLLYERLGQPEILLQAYSLCVILVSILIVLGFERWFYPEYESSLKLKGFGRGMRTALPMFILIPAWFAFRLAMGYALYDGAEVNTLLQGVRAGINEEAAFRGIATALLLRQFRSEKNIWVPAVFTGIFFGCSHLVNLFSGEELANTLLNVIFAASFGIIAGVIFTFSGNLWPVAILHSLYDTLAFCITEEEAAPGWPVLCEVGLFMAGAVIYAILLRRKSGMAVALWAEKWQNRPADTTNPCGENSEKSDAHVRGTDQSETELTGG